ncbi:MAG: DUF4347 domain-containing protein, partial [Thermodesulfobacteriota bacterium]|nr:DUF4347 domain-containing protein [Thermodesulfobacteriota bacterium]
MKKNLLSHYLFIFIISCVLALFSNYASAASLTVTSPTGEETLTKGQNYTITWTSSDVSGTIQIDLYKGSTNVLQLAASASNTGSYPFNPPDYLSDGNDYRIGISAMNGTVWDYSPYFIIQTLQGNQHPKIHSFTAEGSESPVVVSGQEVTFICIAYDPDDTDNPAEPRGIVQYHWDWEGDGIIDAISNSPVDVVYTYISSGIYYPTCTVEDDEGEKTKSQPIMITVELDYSNPVEFILRDRTLEGHELNPLNNEPDDAIILRVDWVNSDNIVEAIVQMLIEKCNYYGRPIKKLDIYTHGGDNFLIFFGAYLTNENIVQYKSSFERLNPYLLDLNNEFANILLFACNTAKSEEGKKLVNKLSEYMNSCLYASEDFTGPITGVPFNEEGLNLELILAVVFGDEEVDWDLEYQVCPDSIPDVYTLSGTISGLPSGGNIYSSMKIDAVE